MRALDAEMISAMLTAIQEFVRESFGVREGEGLEAVQVGELSVWIEQGPHAILACIVRGSAPPELKTICEDAPAHSNSRSKVCVKYAGPMERWNDAPVTTC